MDLLWLRKGTIVPSTSLSGSFRNARSGYEVGGSLVGVGWLYVLVPLILRKRAVHSPGEIPSSMASPSPETPWCVVYSVNVCGVTSEVRGQWGIGNFEQLQVLSRGVGR